MTDALTRRTSRKGISRPSSYSYPVPWGILKQIVIARRTARPRCRRVGAENSLRKKIGVGDRAGLAMIVLIGEKTEIALAESAAASGASDGFPRVVSPGDSDALARELRAAEAVVFSGSPFDNGWFQLLDRCLIIVHAGPGGGGVDLERARRLGVVVASVPDAATVEYADLTESIFGQATKSTKSRGLRTPGFDSGAGRANSFRNPRLGIVGFGSVGKEVAKRGAKAGFQVWATDPFAEPETFRTMSVRRAGLADLFGVCDVVSLHVPLGPATLGMINEAALSLSPPGATLIDTAAPDLIDYRSLFGAIAEGRLSRVWLALDREEILGRAADLTHSESVARWVDEGRLNPIDLTPVQSPEVHAKEIARAIEIAQAHLRGVSPKHLLIDPALPRESAAH